MKREKKKEKGEPTQKAKMNDKNPANERKLERKRNQKRNSPHTERTNNGTVR